MCIMETPLPESSYLNFGTSKEAWTQVYLHHYDKVFHFLLRHTRPDQELALDMTSEAFLIMINKASQYVHKDAKSFRNWLFTIAINTLKLHYRKQNRFVYLENSAIDMIKGHEVPTSELEEIITDYEHNLLWQTLSGIIAKLPPEDKMLLDLKYFVEMSQEEIATAMNLNIGTVKSRLHRLQEKLRLRFPHLPEN